MKGMIRWPGVATFFIIIAVIVGFFALFLDSMVRAGLTVALTRANQAEVNIEQVTLNWSPFSVDIKNIEMTDPEMPSHNRFSAGSLR
ncbi:MAG TPA: TIGR03545 family protein, partial [Aliidiomarina sp.]|nr:TIGR03545 family protein [Aliidiomarina sp.]